MYLCRRDGHDVVDTGMRKAWCKRCDCTLALTSEGTWAEVKEGA